MLKKYLSVPEVCLHENSFSKKNSINKPNGEKIDKIQGPLPLSEDQVKRALEDSITNKWCINFKKDPLKGLDLHEITPESVFRYELESLVETRTVSKKIVIYDGKPIDGRKNGEVPDAWAVPVIPPGNFMEGEMTYLIPHSEEVYPCPDCDQECRLYCAKCRGRGRRRMSGQAVLNPDEKSYLEKP